MLPRIFSCSLGHYSLSQTRPFLQQMTNHIRSKSKVTGEGTIQPNGPDLVALLADVPDEDWSRTWAACRTIMLRRTSKRVKEEVDKMRLPAVVRLCELWRDGINRSPPGGGRPNPMENLKIVMNQLPLMTACLVSHHDTEAACPLRLCCRTSTRELCRSAARSPRAVNRIAHPT